MASCGLRFLPCTTVRGRDQVCDDDKNRRQADAAHMSIVDSAEWSTLQIHSQIQLASSAFSNSRRTAAKSMLVNTELSAAGLGKATCADECFQKTDEWLQHQDRVSDGFAMFWYLQVDCRDCHDLHSFATSLIARSGPNSGGGGTRVKHFSMLIGILVCFTSIVPTSSARVVDSTTESTRGSAEPKHSGEQVSLYTGSNTYSAIRKRSFKRACRRALHHPQGVMYRGRRFTAQQLGAQFVSAHPKQSSRIPVRRSSPPEVHRVRLLCWNTGGLGNGLFDELMTWLESSNLDVICITETRWQFTSNWSTCRWHCIHNGPEPGSREKSGVLLMISNRLGTAEQLQFEHLVPGRITHARVFLEHNALDIFGVYQKAWSGRAKESLQQRKIIWKTLEDHMRLIPDRNDLVLLGDFNVSPGQHGSSFGPAAWPATQHQASDSAHLRRIADDHQLVALNTWENKEEAYTYTWGEVRSQIGFISCMFTPLASQKT